MIILKLNPTENTAKEMVWLWEKDEILRQKWENKIVVEEEESLKSSQGCGMKKNLERESTKIIHVNW